MLQTEYSGTSFGTPLFKEHLHPSKRHEIWSQKNVHLIFVSVQPPFKGHLYSEKRDTFSGYSTFNLLSGDTLVLKKRLRKSLKCTLITMMLSQTEQYHLNQCTAIVEIQQANAISQT